VSVLQAVEQFVLYTGVRPSAELIEKAARFARS
jgi:shikimate 5-dehydrogenase